MRPENETPAQEDARLEAREYGKANAAAFCAKFPEAFALLISTYSDGAAQDLFDAMRDDFWGQSWTEHPEWGLTAKAIKKAKADAKPAPKAPPTKIESGAAPREEKRDE